MVSSKYLSVSVCLFSFQLYALPEVRSIKNNDRTLDYILSLPDSQKPYPLVVSIGGSDCRSAYKAHVKFEDLVLKRGYGLLSVEKPGITPTAINEKEYTALNTIHQRVADIKHVLSLLLKCKGWDGSIIIMGGSEGAMVGALLTHECSTLTKASILIAGVGSRKFNFFQEADLLIEKNCKEVRFGNLLAFLVKLYYKAGMTYASIVPQSTQKLFGHTLKYWLSFKDATESIHDKLASVNVPLYIVHGKSDLMALYESAEDLCMDLQNNGHAVVFKSLDSGHDLSNRLEAILEDALTWTENIREKNYTGSSYVC